MKQKSPESSVDVESGGFFMPPDFAYAVSYGGFLSMNFLALTRSPDRRGREACTSLTE